MLGNLRIEFNIAATVRAASIVTLPHTFQLFQNLAEIVNRARTMFPPFSCVSWQSVIIVATIPNPILAISLIIPNPNA